MYRSIVGEIYLLDGSSLAYRAFFALPQEMQTASGQMTNAVFGFTSMLLNLLKDRHPEGVVVAFDRPEPTFRDTILADYKAGRPKTPDPLVEQIELIKEVVSALSIERVELPGYEADDILATLATIQRDARQAVVVVTGDRDAFQLVEDPYVKVLYNRKGVSDYVLYDEASIRERTGVLPAQYPLLAALRGDPSDNLPGVPGIGEKTAAKLINEFGDIEGIYANLSKLSPKLRQALVANEEQVRQNMVVIPLVRDLPLGEVRFQLDVSKWDPSKIKELFNLLELRSLLARAEELYSLETGHGFQDGSEGMLASDGSVATLGHEERDALDSFVADLPLSPAQVVSLLDNLVHVQVLSIHPVWVGESGRSPLLGVALATGGDKVAGAAEKGPVAVWISAENLRDSAVVSSLRALLQGEHRIEIHNGKDFMRTILPMGIDMRGLDIDTLVASYLLDPSRGGDNFGELFASFDRSDSAGRDLLSSFPEGAKQLTLDLINPSVRSQDDASKETMVQAGRNALLVLKVSPVLRDRLREEGMEALYDDIERPLVRVLARMEVVGIRVDRRYLAELSASLTTEASLLEENIKQLAGEDINPNSPSQLREVLYVKLGLAPPRKRTKTGYSTDAASLERLRGTHPIIDALLRYREVDKLRSTYGEKLIAEIGADGRIHASFNQTVARTGRLSSDHPNLHNIPVRTEEGRMFRKAFIPADGYSFLVSDYNQIELRVIAHLSQDPGLLEAFSMGMDVHRNIAARVFGIPPSEVTPTQRNRAKMVSYGLVYGMEAYGLAQRLGTSQEEATAILEAYFAAFPTVKDYMERTVAEARELGYTKTLLGRRRPLPELSSKVYRVRQAAERQAMNAGTQGLAADIFKIALVRLDQVLEERGCASRIVLQVHDEIIVEVANGEEELVQGITKDTMENAFEMSVPLEVEMSWGQSWADAKG